MTVEFVRVAVVGHANTGKTSLIRTLLRDSQFGEVADYAGTTRHVEAAELRIEGHKVLELFDTPGLEDSVALLTQWQTQTAEQDGSTNQKMAVFIDELDAFSDFAQEQKVLRQAFKSDVLLYVIDAREPYLGKYHDELTLLRATGRPIVPVLNFINADVERKKTWREKLIEHGLHAVVEYDTVAFTMEAERRLFEKMQVLCETHYSIFARVIEHNHQQYQDRCRAAASVIADAYVDIAAYRVVVDNDTADKVGPDIQNLVRSAEQRVVSQVLAVFGFDQDDVRNAFLPVENGRWQYDLFAAETYKQFGLQAGSSAARGAAVGAGIDLFVGGISMGTGAALGAIVGAVWGTAQKYGGAIRNLVTGSSYVCVDDVTLALFYHRQHYLLRCLMSRGHAAQQRIEPLPAASDELDSSQQALAKVTRQLRDNHQWSRLAQQTAEPLLGAISAYKKQYKSESKQSAHGSNAHSDNGYGGAINSYGSGRTDAQQRLIDCLLSQDL